MTRDHSQSDTARAVAKNESPERIVVPPDAGLYGTQALVAMFGIMAVVLLTALDQTIVSTALPRVVADLGGFHLYAWVATANLLTSTVMVPIIGALGDLYGRKPFLLASIIIFTTGSLCAGFSQSMIWLILARGLQGVGSGMLQATAFTSVSDMFPQPERRARWQGLITSTFALASLVGPTVGGFLTDGFGWRSVFFISLPFAVLAFTMIWFMLPADLSPRQASRRIDWAGAFFISTAITTLLLTVEWGGSTFAWSSPQIIGLIIATLLLTGIFIWIEINSPAPLLPIDLFKNRTIAVVCIISTLFGFMMFAISYYTPLLMQGGFGLSPSQAGAYLTPMAISVALGSLVCSQIFARLRNMKTLMVIGAIMVLVGASLLVTINGNSSILFLAVILPLTGFGIGMQLPMTTILIQSVVPRSRIGVGTSTIQFLRLIGSTVGTGIIGTIVNTMYLSRINTAINTDMDQRLIDGYHNPQALVDPEISSSLQQIAQELGSQAQAHLDLLALTARNALISGVWVSYAMMLGSALITFGFVALLRVPNYKESGQKTAVGASKTA
jgi:EmrB/QacA subfamily drug resistance transporter